MLRGPFCARPGRVAELSVKPAPQLSPELVRMQEWPLVSQVELRALPASVRSARLLTRSILHGWRLENLADTAQLLVSEIVTNAVRASTAAGQPSQVALLRFWLTSDSRSVLIRVWDGNNHAPVRKNLGPEAEAGRGIPLIETISAQWGWYATDGEGGKIVWAVCSELAHQLAGRRRSHGGGRKMAGQERQRRRFLQGEERAVVAAVGEAHDRRLAAGAPRQRAGEGPDPRVEA